MRVSELLGRTAYDSAGVELGRIADVVVGGPPDDVPAITSVLVTRRRTRLFGYERPEIQGPWLVERLARWLQGPVIEIRFDELRLEPPG